MKKKILHIVNANSNKYFKLLKKNGALFQRILSVQRIYYYKKNENKVVIANVEKVKKNYGRVLILVLVVDDINIQKNYSITLSVKENWVSYSLMIRIFIPEMGQCLKIFYCVTKIRKGEKKTL